MIDFSLILPTYNERRNLAPLLARLKAVLQGYRYEIIVVDDDSSDHTWEEAERLRALHPQLRVIRRVHERGLSSAVIRGFREAHGRVLGVMDADLQHDETILPQLIGCTTEADFVVASRTVTGRGIPVWGWHRRFTSSVATMLARLVVNVSLCDPLSGFFTIRRSLFRQLDDDTLNPQGFKILLYLYLHSRRRLGAERVSVKEVGFTFRERLHGESKLTTRVMWEYLRMLYHFRHDSPISQGFLRFAGVGALGVLLNSLLLLLLHEAVGLHYLLAGALAIEVAIVHNFSLNELWTFGHRRSGRPGGPWARFVKFQVVSIGGMLINLAILALLRSLLGFPLLASNLIGIAGAAVYNYITNKLWTWGVHGTELATITAGDGAGHAGASGGVTSAGGRAA